jgi:hypothetical protein
MATEGAKATNNDPEKKISTRQRNLDEWKSRIIWSAAGLGGLIALFAATGSAYLPMVPAILRAAEITLVVLAVVPLAYARVNFEWAASSIEHELEANPELKETNELDKLPEDKRRWPKRAEWAWLVALGMILVSAVAFLVSVWWSV